MARLVANVSRRSDAALGAPAGTGPAPPLRPRPPPINFHYLQYGVGLATETVASAGGVCPAGRDDAVHPRLGRRPGDPGRLPLARALVRGRRLRILAPGLVEPAAPGHPAAASGRIPLLCRRGKPADALRRRRAGSCPVRQRVGHRNRRRRELSGRRRRIPDQSHHRDRGRPGLPAAAAARAGPTRPASAAPTSFWASESPTS